MKKFFIRGGGNNVLVKFENIFKYGGFIFMKKIFCSIIMIVTLILTSSNILLAQDTSNDESVPYNQEEYQKIVDFLEGEWKFSFGTTMPLVEPKVAIYENGEEGVWNDEKPLEFIDAKIDEDVFGGIYTYTISISNNNGYDINNPQTWSDIEWEVVKVNGVKSKRVSKIGNSFKGLNPDKLILLSYEYDDFLTTYRLFPDQEAINLNYRDFPYLKYLDCSSTSKDTLDLSDCSNLEQLNCSNSLISTLNISNCSNLKTVDCSNTKVNKLDLLNNSNLKNLDFSNCSLNLKELIKIDSEFPNALTEGSFSQNIFNKISYMKGDIKEFGNGESTKYEWYFENDDTPSTLPAFNGSKYDFTDYPDYIGKKIYCKISDSGITLTSNLTTITDSINDVDIEVNIIEAPTSIAKGDEPVKQQLKANAIPNPSYTDIDKSVRWEISDNNSIDTKIDENGILTISPDETSQKIKVKAISNFNSHMYATATIFIKSALSAPTGLKWNDKTAIWNPVYNSSGYELQIFKERNSEALDTILLKENVTEYSLEKYFTSYGNYIFKIKAVGDGEYYEDSAYSESEIKEYTSLESLQKSIDKANKILKQGNPNIDELIGAIADLSDEIITYNN